MKQLVTMSKWLLTKHNENYSLTGTADHHPVLGKNVYISYTTSMVSYEVKDDVLYYETLNTKYKCPLKYMLIDKAFDQFIEGYTETMQSELKNTNIDKIIQIELNIYNNNIDDDDTKRIFELASEGIKEIEIAKEKEEKRLIDIVSKYENNSIYFELSSVDAADPIAYKMCIEDDEKIGIVKGHTHVGTFQDSVLYCVPNILDFRYFPYYNSLETYHWSNNIERVYVKNVSDHALEFNCEIIQPNEIKAFTGETQRDGLFSPDAYDGSSAIVNTKK